MSKDIREMIDKVKNFKQFVNENKMNVEMVTAYQGSNANHEGFDIKKIGTGEGNVVFGFGFYFTDYLLKCLSILSIILHAVSLIENNF